MANEKSHNKVVKNIVVVMSVTILVLFASLIIGSILDSSAFADVTTTGSTTNETLSAVDNVSSSVFAIKSTNANALCGLTEAINATGGEAVPATNYTFTSSTCALILKSPSNYIGEDINVSYTWNYTESQLAGINTTYLSTQFGAFVTAIIGFFAVIGVIIAIVWLISYIKPLFSKEDGIQTFAGN